MQESVNSTSKLCTWILLPLFVIAVMLRVCTPNRDRSVDFTSTDDPVTVIKEGTRPVFVSSTSNELSWWHSAGSIVTEGRRILRVLPDARSYVLLALIAVIRLLVRSHLICTVKLPVIEAAMPACYLKLTV